ncbi:MAG: hypothetical protein ACO1SV_08605 [Fimbriimonas sp.]
MKLGLLRLEGHTINGFGDGGRLEPVSLAPGAEAAADALLSASPETDARIQRVLELIEGFESPYGLELLATVHWVATQGGAGTADEAVNLAHQWSPRERLSDFGWLRSSALH